MYIYIDKTGTIRTQIDHGEPVRQGNPLRLYICFEPDDPNVGLNSYMTAQCKVEDINPDWSNIFVFSLKPELETFKKFKTSEITYDLVDGKKYRVFQYSSNNGALPCEEHTTLHFGKLECSLVLYDANGVQVLEDTAEINVSATYGKIEPKTGITRTEYQELLEEISKRVKADGGTANNLTLTGTTIGNFNISQTKKFVLNEGQQISIEDVADYDYIEYNSNIYVYSHHSNDYKVYRCIKHTDTEFKVETLLVGRVSSFPQLVINAFQDKLTSGENIKTINGESLLGSGDITVGVSGVVQIDDKLDLTSTNPVQNKVIATSISNCYTKEEVEQLIKQYVGNSGKTITINSPSTTGSVYYSGEENQFSSIFYGSLSSDLLPSFDTIMNDNITKIIFNIGYLDTPLDMYNHIEFNLTAVDQKGSGTKEGAYFMASMFLETIYICCDTGNNWSMLVAKHTSGTSI